jgi:ATP-dependent helicase/nuclease subunit A
VLRLPPIPRPPKAGKDGAPDATELPWRDSLTTPRETPEETLRTLEARQAARWVAAQIEAGKPPKEIMVLARQRNRLSPLADELRLLGIATVQPEKADLAEAPEVADLVALLDVLVSPGARPVAGPRAQVAAVRRQRCGPLRAGPAAPRGGPPGPPLAGTAAGRG